MRHLKSYRKLGRDTAHRQAMLRNLATSLIEHGKIETTLARGKALRPYVEKLITVARKGTLHSRRQVAKKLYGVSACQKVCGDLAERFSRRTGGYTRLLKTGTRSGDGAAVCLLELIDYSGREGVTAAEARQRRRAERAEKMRQEQEEAEKSRRLT